MHNTKAVLKEPGQMIIKDSEIGDPKDNEVQVKVCDVSICGSDMHGFTDGPYLPPKDPKQEIGLGHETAGIISKVGKKVKNFKVGDRVAIEPGVPDGTCDFCLSGHYNVCPNVDFLATAPNYKGSLTNYINHPAEWTYHLPDNMSLVEGAMTEPASVAIHAAESAGNLLGKTVIILGAGAEGLLTTMAVKIAGAAKVVVIDVMENRLMKAKELGANATFNGKDKNIVSEIKSVVGKIGADFVYECAGSNATAQIGLKVVKNTGTFFILGTIPGTTPVEFLKINREVTIHTLFRYVNDYPKTIKMIASGKFNVMSIVDKYFVYNDIQKAFEFATQHKSDFIKSVVIVDKSYR
ncbi:MULTISPECIES: NAD(P)-dependent alcohol dehydrogenase [Lactobacillus]|uniref:NAD(P)-dependent alcohol dehydrogenase n=1 Tax=Lactobacillus TaxID=1578 RepID=UPI001C6A74EA|nr:MULTISPECIES: NAD(P)-dependent alcohol dehydrogenase [Lactobacillus]MCX8720416.1 NAD(P)-dependent alcohol dehydrogenase [Lactobacillus sp. B4010]MCX8723480.1 NAD(P)-dependent alcohol dehydrogenase [Lactobacillus sp. B4005]MCX8731561.1 NAD(P)-dependent alcohol dehydrogenase [Lactobacillus sp. B4015]MCX8733782.1 NAD(P)-dependent alcohol dehydrogenase [Lactobacillus sp. B4012]QYN57295.1 NAD(P)-dependent alcohol dehydrogenase [Lactobacillus panisapium]